jgi:hypothetical protein
VRVDWRIGSTVEDPTNLTRIDPPTPGTDHKRVARWVELRPQCEPRVDGVAGRLRDRYTPFFVALTNDGQQHLAALNLSNVESAQLADAQSTAVEDLDDDGIARVDRLGAG